MLMLKWVESLVTFQKLMILLKTMIRTKTELLTKRSSDKCSGKCSTFSDISIFDLSDLTFPYSVVPCILAIEVRIQISSLSNHPLLNFRSFYDILGMGLHKFELIS